MTNPANFPRLHQINPTLDQTADIIDAETVSPDSEAAAIVKRVPDSTAIAQSFLVHYESFVGSPIDHALVWRTETFGSQEDASPWSPSWRKVGVVSIGGLATVAAASALLPKDTLQGVAQAAQKLVSNSSPESRSARSAAANQAQSSGVTATNSIVFGTTLPEFSSSSATPKPSMPKIKVPAVISPGIRAPLPGQVIGQQPVAAAPARQLPLRGTAQVLQHLARRSRLARSSTAPRVYF